MQPLSRAYTWLQYFLQVLFTACIYFMLARISLLLQFESSNATPVWPPSGFALAMILLWGIRMAPGILFGAFAANFLIFITNQTVDYPAAATLSLIIGAGNTLEALTGYYLLKKFIGHFNLDTFLDKVEHILKYSLTAGLMCVIGATVGTLTVYGANIITDKIVPLVWLTWWLGDFSGVLLVTTFMLVWLKSFKVNISLVSDIKSLRPETIIFFLVVIFSGGVIFDNWLFEASIFRWAYWIIPVLVWAAMRFSQRELITALVMFSLIAIWGTVNHRGPFSALSLNESLLALQAFIAIMVITKLTLHVSVLERKQTESILRKTGEELEVRVNQRTSQLQERNQFVESILNSSFDSIIVLDRELRCISINKIAKNQLRLPYPENVVGKKVTEIPSFLLPPGVMGDIYSALNGETIHRDKFASPISEVYFEVDYIPLKNEKGVYAVMIVGHDITQRIHSAEEIREQKISLEDRNVDLQKRNEELSSFAYVASHDLQEPLRKIQIFSKRIMESESENLTPAGKSYFDRMKNAAERMQMLIEDLLAYSRTGTMEGDYEKIHLRELIEEVKEALRFELIQKKATVNAENLCECIVIPFQFRQLLHNLFTNSLKFSKNGTPPVITVRSTIDEGKDLNHPALDGEKEYCHISIADNGIGFEPEFNEQIFGLFQRLHGKSEYPGTGIGLSIVKKIIENHKGVIAASGEPGKGAVFNIYIPHRDEGIN